MTDLLVGPKDHGHPISDVRVREHVQEARQGSLHELEGTSNQGINWGGGNPAVILALCLIFLGCKTPVFFKNKGFFDFF